MRRIGAHAFLATAGLAAWLAVILLPLAGLGVAAARSPGPALPWSAWETAALAGRSVGLAAAVAAAAVVLGYVPGRLLGTAGRRGWLLLPLVLAPLVLPQYMLYYIWAMLMSPTSPLGRLLAEQPQAVVRGVSTALTVGVLVLWAWPVAALLAAQGWRNLDADMLRAARLEAGPWRRLTRIHLPLLARPLALALAACFVLVLGEHATFHLAGVETIGSQLAVVYELTGRTESVARAAWPLVLAAGAVAIALSRRLRTPSVAPPLDESARSPAWQWAWLGALVAWSLAAPVVLLAASVESLTPLARFWGLQWDGLATSFAASAGAAALSLVIAVGVLAAERFGRAGRAVAGVAQWTTLAAMFLPGSLVGAAIIRFQVALDLPPAVGQGWWILSVGLAARFSGLALVVLKLARDGADRHLHEMAAVDGAGAWATWRRIDLPRAWPLAAGAGLLVLLFSLTEVAATMMLLPPGVPAFAQRLLNQMHYARDQHVIASCLMLVTAYLALVAPVALALAAARWRRAAALLLVAAVAAVGVAGCSGTVADAAAPEVLGLIGTSGRGPGEFLYPRAIDLDAAGNLFVADRTGRIQQFSADGKLLATIDLPLTEKGYPTGLTAGPDGLLYVPDTHYHRVLAYDAAGRIVREFGRFGTGDGEFIYPTDVAIGPDGRLYVSEYGGNDRISLYGPRGDFLRTFGRPGSGEGEFSRPSALAIDAARGVLYVADACNHRIVKYTLNGEWMGAFGRVGTGPGELRYPYGLALIEGGSLAVCESGNNRIQIFGPDGHSLRLLGGAGREPGQLAYPWGVAAGGRRLYVVDSGNNRIQIWRQ